MTKTIYEWFQECLYIQRNASWQGVGGGLQFLYIKCGIKEATGMSEEAFWNWLDRIKKYKVNNERDTNA